MRHADHVALLRDGVVPGGVWADLGSGEGAFTLALADLLGAGGRIHSVDKDASALKAQQRAMQERFPEVAVEFHRADFTRTLDLPPLDGIVMANSLHFVRDKAPVLALVRRYLRPGSRLLLVEYDSDQGNPYVPHPLSFETWRRMAEEAGFVETRRLTTAPSRFLRQIYSALSLAP